jgi:hypothetical protein
LWKKIPLLWQLDYGIERSSISLVCPFCDNFELHFSFQLCSSVLGWVRNVAVAKNILSAL